MIGGTLVDRSTLFCFNLLLTCDAASDLLTSVASCSHNLCVFAWRGLTLTTLSDVFKLKKPDHVFINRDQENERLQSLISSSWLMRLQLLNRTIFESHVIKYWGSVLHSGNDRPVRVSVSLLSEDQWNIDLSVILFTSVSINWPLPESNLVHRLVAHGILGACISATQVSWEWTEKQPWSSPKLWRCMLKSWTSLSHHQNMFIYFCFRSTLMHIFPNYLTDANILLCRWSTKNNCPLNRNS